MTATQTLIVLGFQQNMALHIMAKHLHLSILWPSMVFNSEIRSLSTVFVEREREKYFLLATFLNKTYLFNPSIIVNCFVVFFYLFVFSVLYTSRHLESIS